MVLDKSSRWTQASLIRIYRLNLSYLGIAAMLCSSTSCTCNVVDQAISVLQDTFSIISNVSYIEYTYTKCKSNVYTCVCGTVVYIFKV